MDFQSTLLKRVLALSATCFLTCNTPAVASVVDITAGGFSVESMPPVWLALPFVILLLMIATGPIVYPRFWEHHYRKVSLLLGGAVALYYAIRMDGGGQQLEHTLEEYISFIALLSSLFVVAGGILLRIDRPGSPVLNILLLLFGAILSNLVGTTGASMLLIRPFLRMNEHRLKPFHIVFFIFIISNIGGALTPVGDPPLFLGFLRGVPFFWVIEKLWFPWVLTIGTLLFIFYILDARTVNSAGNRSGTGQIGLTGRRNLLYLIPLIGSIFIDPAVISWVPDIRDIIHVPFGIREVVMLSIAVLAYRTANPEALEGNEFNFEPIKEVAFLFAGLFATMIPALQLIGEYAKAHSADFSVTHFFWLTGVLSGVLDNAPTYLNFFSAALGKFGTDSHNIVEITRFAHGVSSPVAGDANSSIYLMAISVASVYFGAFTYIGNAPNFMVRNIATQTGADVPDFLEYLYRYSIPVLLPVFTVIWYILFKG
jgi:Na+/H+ antiporter NhaD/arsenite permease-like protein